MRGGDPFLPPAAPIVPAHLPNCPNSRFVSAFYERASPKARRVMPRSAISMNTHDRTRRGSTSLSDSRRADGKSDVKQELSHEAASLRSPKLCRISALSDGPWAARPHDRIRMPARMDDAREIRNAEFNTRRARRGDLERARRPRLDCSYAGGDLQPGFGHSQARRDVTRVP